MNKQLTQNKTKIEQENNNQVEKCQTADNQPINNKWKKLFSYYKPYMGVFLADLFFAFVSAGVALIRPIITRYITGTVIYFEKDRAIDVIGKLAILFSRTVIAQG